MIGKTADRAVNGLIVSQSLVTEQYNSLYTERNIIMLRRMHLFITHSEIGRHARKKKNRVLTPPTGLKLTFRLLVRVVLGSYNKHSANKCPVP